MIPRQLGVETAIDATAEYRDTLRWRCALIGSEAMLVECGALLLSRGHHVVAVVSDRPATRDWAQACGVPVLVTPGDLAGLDPFDYLFSITNLSVLPAAIVALPRQAAINFHDGPLPGHAGLNAPAWALLQGDRVYGVTWHLMTDQVDRGDIVAQRRFAIEPGETAHSLNTRCLVEGINAFAALIDGLASGTITPLRQSDAPGLHHHRTDRPAAAAAIRWDRPADTIAATLRALDFGGHTNPLGIPKTSHNGRIVLIREAAVTQKASSEPAGTIMCADGDRLCVATGTVDLAIVQLIAADGHMLTVADAVALYGLREGDRFVGPDDADMLSAIDEALALHEPWWRRRLAERRPLMLPLVTNVAAAADQPTRVDDALDGRARAALVFAAGVACLGRVADTGDFDLGFTDPIFVAHDAPVAGWVADQRPLRVTIDWSQPLDMLAAALSGDIGQLHRQVGHGIDLIARCPDLYGTAAGLPIAVTLVDRLDDATLHASAHLTVAIRTDGRACRWLHSAAVLDTAALDIVRNAFHAMLAAAIADPLQPVAALPLMDAAVRSRVIETWNDTPMPSREDACLHHLFAEQAARTPDASAVTARGVTLSYAALDARTNRLARHLIAWGVGPGTLVGLFLDRTVDLLVALIAVHKAGGAYVPLDPAYPALRIAHMLRDSAAPVIVTQAHLAAALPPNEARIVQIDTDWPTIALLADTAVDGGARSDDLAYVIYTSGSTGLPKGVMVEHRNVANFYIGMDRVIETGGTWLSMTSLSFDISVLELCWTTARGAHVVIGTPENPVAPSPVDRRPVAFSLFYFASADGDDITDRYRLLLDGARFADTHGFAAVWTPERHFHAFGGLYPNPSVTGAAIAAITTRIAIRGGSVVMPLHHPARVAEEWALVDNLSNGRVGIAFASGWQPNDFVLRPGAFADKSAALMDGIDAVRGLWRGETRTFPGPLGTDVEIATYPRPVQPELPFWITAAGNPATFAAAGTAGASILTHLLGQTTAELADKIAVYRQARAAAGHDGPGHVTLMLHSFVGDDADAVRAAVRAPLIAYLRTSTDLMKAFAWSFPAFRRRPGMSDTQPDLAALDPDEMDALLEHAFERYYATGGLFGTPAQCLAMVDRVRTAGVDEIGCLIDFGVPAQAVLDHLPALDTLRRLATEPDRDRETPAALMTRYGVTHLQCTPSMAAMLLDDEDAVAAMANLRQMMVGGEAFPPALAARLDAIVAGRVVNMYGPTETTIWSTTHVVDARDGTVPIGRPLANQRCHVLDTRQQPMPPGVAGELVIVGAGVVRGYLALPALTAEKFLSLPFAPGTRAYRTGDLVRQGPDGTLAYLGRIDGQVKIRGYRIELGEIEAVLSGHPSVQRAIAAVREDTPGDVRLVVYYVATGAGNSLPTMLRDHLRGHLPAFMMPSHVVRLDAFPQTPNGKVDRARLPPPDLRPIEAPCAIEAKPTGGMEENIAAIWRDVLKIDGVGRQDNFFDVGGHSLLAVQMHRAVRASVGRSLSLTDIFRFPTIAALARHLADGENDAAARQATTRADNRRAAFQRRRAGTAAPQPAFGEG